MKLNLLITTFLLTLIFGLSHNVLAKQLPLSIENYWTELEATHNLISNMSDPNTQSNLSALSKQANYWAAVKQVRLSDGSLLPLDHSHLVAQLQATPPNLTALETMLSTLLAARETQPIDSQNGTELDKLAAILAQPQFKWEATESAFLTWWTDLRNRWRAFLNNLLSPADDLFAFGLAYILPAISVLALIIVFIYILRGLGSDLVTEDSLAYDDLLTNHPLNAKIALNQAQNFSDSGDYRTAVRYLYLSALLLLEERDLLRYDRALTNREYLDRLRQHPDLAGTLQDVVDIFDRVWYGYQAIDQTTYNRYATKVDTLRHYR